MSYEAALKDYERFEFTDPAGRWTRPVWRRGSGPAVIVIHEMPGLHPLVIRFADRVAAAGMTVFCPSLFGDPGRPVTLGYALGEMIKGICIRREFNVWATDKSSPIVDWLRALAGHRSGAIDLCQYRRIGSLLGGVVLGLGHYELNVAAAERVVDEDHGAGVQIGQAREDGRPPKRIVHVPGKRGGA